jgi:hypothetical protein
MTATITLRNQITSLRYPRAGATYLGERTINLLPALSRHNPLACKISQRSDRMGDEVLPGGPGMRSPS